MHEWFKALHLVGVLFWMGSLLLLSRYMTFTMRTASMEARREMLQFARRTYTFIAMPGGFITLLFGLLMLFGVGVEGATMGDYLMPVVRDAAGEKLLDVDGNSIKSLWWITFHVKLVMVAVLLGMDIALGRKIMRLSREESPTHPNPAMFTVVHGIMGLMVVVIILLMLAGVLKGQ